MKTSGQKSFLALLCIFIIYAGAVSQTQAADKTLRLALEDWPPYIDRTLPNYGIAAELVTTALSRAGYATIASFENWALTLEGAGIGVYDVITAAWHSKQREERFEFSEPYLTNEIKFIKRKDKSLTYENLSDLRGLTIGVVDHYAYSPEFDESNLLIKVPSNHLIQNLSLLQQGKIDLTLDDTLVIRHQLKTYLPSTADQFEFLPKPLASRKLYMMVSRTNPDYKQIVTDFNEEIRKMKEDGTFYKIIKKYEVN